jgi:hypothetical protein
MRGLLGLCLSVILGFIVIAAAPRGAESALSLSGYHGKVTIENRRYEPTGMTVQSSGDAGATFHFKTQFPARTRMVISGLHQGVSYDFLTDYDLNGSTDGTLTFFLEKGYRVWAYDL